MSYGYHSSKHSFVQGESSELVVYLVKKFIIFCLCLKDGEINSEIQNISLQQINYLISGLSIGIFLMMIPGKIM